MSAGSGGHRGLASRAIWAALAVLAGTLIGGIAPALAQTISYDLSTTSVLKINLPVSQAVTVVVSEAIGEIVPADATIADAQPITDRFEVEVDGDEVEVELEFTWKLRAPGTDAEGQASG
jgi:pilus assembly protein CpaC